MPLYRCVFQNFKLNRLNQCYQYFHSIQNRIMTAHYNISGSCNHLIRSKTDAITQKQIYFFDANDCIHQKPKTQLSVSNNPLPFEAIPCADKPSRSRLSGFTAIATVFRRLLTGNWDSNFHEEIHECHQKLGPIFRKSLGPNQIGEYDCR